MTKRLLAVVMLCVVAGAGSRAEAQSANANARIGVMGGINLSTFSGEDSSDDLENRMGLLAGLSYARPRPGSFGFEMDLLFSAKGAKSSDGPNEVTFNLNYLELPVLLRYDFATTGGIRPHLSAGPSFALRTGCSGEGNNNGVSVSVDCDELQDALNVEFKSIDVGATVGGGLDFAVGRNTFTVGARYTLGLVSIVEDESTKNRAISLFAGISMPLRR